MLLTLAQDATSPDFGPYLEYGLLGLMFVAVLLGWVVPKYVIDRERERADRIEDQLTQLRARFEGEIIPLLTRVVILLEQRTASREG